MSRQLVYTSAPSGLRPGTRGFTTVAASPGLPPPLVSRLEALSTYRFLTTPGERSAGNPVSFAHLRLRHAGGWCHVLSRRSAAGSDYTGRANFIAHHAVLDREEMSRGGPAWMLQQTGWLIDHWEGDPRELSDTMPLPDGDAAAATCRRWASACGDAGWGGALLTPLLDDPRTPVYLVYEPGAEVLGLVAESLALLPDKARWAVTFDTYHTAAAADTQCVWRCVAAGSEAEREARRAPAERVLDLTTLPAAPPAADAVQAAREGRTVEGRTPTGQRGSKRDRTRGRDTTYALADDPDAGTSWAEPEDAFAGSLAADAASPAPPPMPTRRRGRTRGQYGSPRRWPLMLAVAAGLLLAAGLPLIFFATSSEPSERDEARGTALTRPSQTGVDDPDSGTEDVAVPAETQAVSDPGPVDVAPESPPGGTSTGDGADEADPEDEAVESGDGEDLVDDSSPAGTDAVEDHDASSGSQESDDRRPPVKREPQPEWSVVSVERMVYTPIEMVGMGPKPPSDPSTRAFSNDASILKCRGRLELLSVKCDQLVYEYADGALTIKPKDAAIGSAAAPIGKLKFEEKNKGEIRVTASFDGDSPLIRHARIFVRDEEGASYLFHSSPTLHEVVFMNWPALKSQLSPAEVPSLPYPAKRFRTASTEGAFNGDVVIDEDSRLLLGILGNGSLKLNSPAGEAEKDAENAAARHKAKLGSLEIQDLDSKINKADKEAADGSKSKKAQKQARQQAKSLRDEREDILSITREAKERAEKDRDDLLKSIQEALIRHEYVELYDRYGAPMIRYELRLSLDGDGG